MGEVPVSLHGDGNDPVESEKFIEKEQLLEGASWVSNRWVGTELGTQMEIIHSNRMCSWPIVTGEKVQCTDGNKYVGLVLGAYGNFSNYCCLRLDSLETDTETKMFIRDQHQWIEVEEAGSGRGRTWTWRQTQQDLSQLSGVLWRKYCPPKLFCIELSSIYQPPSTQSTA